MAKNLVVVIPTSNRADLIKRTLYSLSKCRLPNNYRGTILVENGLPKVAESIAKEFQNSLKLTYVFQQIGNKSRALNSALELIEDSLIVFFDDDVRIEPTILEAYAKAAEKITEGEFYGGPFQAEYTKKPPEWLIEFLPVSAVGWSYGNRTKYIQKGNLFFGVNWAAFDKDIKRLGRFSLLHGPGSTTGAVGQETEMQKKLLENGVKGRYVPDAKVWHFVPPERCSPEFTLRRAFKWGIQGGLDYKGPLIRLYKKGAIDGIRAFAGLAQREPKKRFKPYYKFCYSSGMIKGKIISKRTTSKNILSLVRNNRLE